MIFNRIRPVDESGKYKISLEKMHWEQLLRLRNGKVRCDALCYISFLMTDDHMCILPAAKYHFWRLTCMLRKWKHNAKLFFTWYRELWFVHNSTCHHITHYFVSLWATHWGGCVKHLYYHIWSFGFCIWLLDVGRGRYGPTVFLLIFLFRPLIVALSVYCLMLIN